MSVDLHVLANEIADRPYSIEVIEDQTTEGEAILFVSHPELPGCVAQGDNLEEALNNLHDATVDYILSLLEDGLPVPSPIQVTLTSSTVASSNTTAIVTVRGGEKITEKQGAQEYADNKDQIQSQTIIIHN